MAQDAGIEFDYDDPATFDRELARLQAETDVPESADGQVVTGTVIGTTGDESAVEFMGRRFRIADKIGLMPLLKFSAHAEMKTTDPKALGAMYAMLRDCIHPGTPGCGECKDCKAGDEEKCASYDAGDWHAFEDHAMTTKADAEDLLDVITHTMELISGRPTGPPSASSSGRRAISDRSTARSSGRRRAGSKR